MLRAAAIAAMLVLAACGSGGTGTGGSGGAAGGGSGSVGGGSGGGSATGGGSGSVGGGSGGSGGGTATGGGGGAGGTGGSGGSGGSGGTGGSGGSGGGSAGTGGGSGSVGGGSGGGAATGGGSGGTGGGSTGGGSGTGGGAAGGGSGGSGGGTAGTIFTETFGTGADAGAWPAPWTIAGGVSQADVSQGRGRLRPIISTYALGRMKAPLGCINCEVTFRFSFTDNSTQGIGLYVRSSGGWLTTTNPQGAGYAVFVERFRPVGIPMGQVGVWHEVNGNEIQNLPAANLPTLFAGTVHQVRFRVEQMNATTTRLRAKAWVDGTPEPAAWMVDNTDTTASLQNIPGQIAVDAWSQLQSGTASDLFIDDIAVVQLP